MVKTLGNLIFYCFCYKYIPFKIYFKYHRPTKSETKLNAKPNINSIMLPHYTFCHSPSNSAAGGVGIYINDSLQYKIRDDPKFLEEGNQNIWIEIITNNSIFCHKNRQYLKNIMVGVIYRHPSNCIKTLMNKFEATLQRLQYLNSPFYIAGNINID